MLLRHSAQQYVVLCLFETYVGDDMAHARLKSQTYPVTFPIAKKSNVNGNDANEVFKWLKSKPSASY